MLAVQEALHAAWSCAWNKRADRTHCSLVATSAQPLTQCRVADKNPLDSAKDAVSGAAKEAKSKAPNAGDFKPNPDNFKGGPNAGDVKQALKDAAPGKVTRE
jgi:hypothetical protein